MRFKTTRKLPLMACLIASTASHAFVPAHSVKTDYKPPLSVEVNSQSNAEKRVEQSMSFVEGFAREGIAFLENENLSEQEKQKKFRALLQSNFNMKTIARFAMGRYWRQASSEQKDEYFKLFEEMVVNIYSERFSDYQGQEFVVENAHQDGKNDFIVKSSIIPKDGPEIRVDWRVRIKDNKESVVDIIVEGVSMALTQRSDFASVIQRGGGNVEVLLTHLRERTS